MNSYELVTNIEKLLNKFTDKNPLLLSLKMIEDASKAHLEKFVVILNMSGTSAQNHNETLRNDLSNIIQVLKKIDIKDLFVDIDNIEKALDQYDNEVLNLPELKSTHILKGMITQFSTEYGKYLQNYALDAAMRMILTARSLLFSMLIFRATLISIRTKIERPLKSYENMRDLGIVLASDLEFADFAKKLLALNSIYTELCGLLNVSITEYPVQIAKIESGSLFAKLFGESNVIKLMTDLVVSGINFLYRNFTHEGKIVSIPRKVEAIESVLNLSKKLDEHGIDTSQMKEHINKSSVAIARDLNSLLAGEPVIEVNETQYSIGNLLEQEYIEQSKRLLIENKDDEDNKRKENGSALDVK
jgi:hypothetical protein